mmetsp:Transcript_89132/g.216205  ORF Transcript_89132/g.216205 Transcript_89132/m.216205 type:complete len:219 (+) Transcript_89132:1119-1775(+)
MQPHQSWVSKTLVAGHLRTTCLPRPPPRPPPSAWPAGGPRLRAATLGRRRLLCMASGTLQAYSGAPPAGTGSARTRCPSRGTTPGAVRCPESLPTAPRPSTPRLLRRRGSLCLQCMGLDTLQACSCAPPAETGLVLRRQPTLGTTLGAGGCPASLPTAPRHSTPRLLRHCGSPRLGEKRPARSPGTSPGAAAHSARTRLYRWTHSGDTRRLQISQKTQ